MVIQSGALLSSFFVAHSPWGGFSSEMLTPPEKAYLTEYWHQRKRRAGPRIYASSDIEARYKAVVLEEMFGYPELVIIGVLNDFDEREIYHE